MKNKKAFTLIELLAVIIILGLLMAIAIPSISKYIEQSRKKTYINSVQSYVDSVSKEISSGNIRLDDETASYYIPFNCIPLERGGKSPNGDWDFGYVGLSINNGKSKYYIYSKDVKGMGIASLEMNKLKYNDVQTITTGKDDLVALGGKSNLLVVPETCDYNNLVVKEGIGGLPNTEVIEGSFKWKKYSLVEIGTLNKGIDTWDTWDPYKAYLYQGKMNFDNNKLYRGILKNKDDDRIETLKSNPSKVNQTHQDFMWPDIKLDNPSNVITLEFEVGDGRHNIVFDVVDDGYKYGEQSLQFYKKYKTEIMQAVSSDLNFVGGPWSFIHAGFQLEYEKENIEEYLTNKGYTEETLNDFIKWGKALLEDNNLYEPDEEVKSFFYDILFLYQLETSLDKYSESSLIHSHSGGFDEGYDWGRLSLKIEELNLIETVGGESGDYPENGEKDGYWYVFEGENK